MNITCISYIQLKCSSDSIYRNIMRWEIWFGIVDDGNWCFIRLITKFSAYIYKINWSLCYYMLLCILYHHCYTIIVSMELLISMIKSVVHCVIDEKGTVYTLNSWLKLIDPPIRLEGKMIFWRKWLSLTISKVLHRSYLILRTMQEKTRKEKVFLAGYRQQQ